MCICFAEYVQAFDCVKHELLLGMLEELEIGGLDLRRIRNDGWIAIQTGVRQIVFCHQTYSICIVRELYARSNEVLFYSLVNGILIIFRYADDTALFADTEKKLQELVSIMAKESEKLGLMINCQNTFSNGLY